MNEIIVHGVTFALVGVNLVLTIILLEKVKKKDE